MCPPLATKIYTGLGSKIAMSSQGLEGLHRQIISRFNVGSHNVFSLFCRKGVVFYTNNSMFEPSPNIQERESAKKRYSGNTNTSYIPPENIF